MAKHDSESSKPTNDESRKLPDKPRQLNFCLRPKHISGSPTPTKPRLPEEDKSPNNHALSQDSTEVTICISPWDMNAMRRALPKKARAYKIAKHQNFTLPKGPIRKEYRGLRFFR